MRNRNESYINIIYDINKEKGDKIKGDKITIFGDKFGNIFNEIHSQNKELILITLLVLQFEISGNDDNDEHP